MPLDASIHDYELHEKLGAGTYATVYRAVKKDTNEVCAIKCVEKTKLNSQVAENNIVTEIKLLKTLKHPHIVEMRDFLWDSKHIYIITEYCNGGDLSSYIRRRHMLPESICKIFLRQLALAMRFLREHEVSHFDLKPQNLLLCRSPGRYILKVADFGFAQHLKLGEANTAIKGSLLYMAPEIVMKETYDARADLWSIGTIFYECLFGRAPYRSGTIQELLDKIRLKQRIEIPSHVKISVECEDLLRRLLRHDPANRITFEDFFNHEFIDLEHMPSEENLKTAAELFTEAVKADGEGKPVEAYKFYCDGLKYFQPIVNEEPDATKRQALRARMNSYIERAETIRVSVLKDTSSGSLPKLPPLMQRQTSKTATVTVVDVAQVLEPSDVYKQLYKLSSSSPAIKHALDIGREAELVVGEKNYERALESFKSALGSLVPLLQKEPKGTRRDLLYHQIEAWMKEAERLKDLIEAKDTEVGDEAIGSDGHDRCCIQ